MNPLRLSFTAAALALIWSAGPLSTTAFAQCSDETTYEYGLSDVSRLNGNTEKLYNETVMYGNYYNWWEAYIASGWSLNYVTQTTLDWHTSNLAYVHDTWEPTLQVWGPGHYATSSAHNAWTPYCEVWFANNIYTLDSADVQRPLINLTYPPPMFLGSGVLQSGTFLPTANVYSDGSGAPEQTATYTITAGSQYGTLSCSTCWIATYTATAAMPCAVYLVNIVADYAGFRSLPLSIFNNSPSGLASMYIYGYGLDNASGWGVDYTYKVTDACGEPLSPMGSWVEVNESFTDSGYVYPWPVTNWPLPGVDGWELGKWADAQHFSSFGDFVDHIWERNVNSYPVPLPWGWNQYAEDANSTVLRTHQWFKAGTSNNGYGLLLNPSAITMTKYIDHGTAQ